MSDETDVDETAEEDQSVISSAQYRYKHLSTVVTMSVVVAYLLLVLGQAFGYTAGPTEPGTWATFSLAFIGAIAYSVGVDTLKEAAALRSK